MPWDGMTCPQGLKCPVAPILGRPGSRGLFPGFFKDKVISGAWQAGWPPSHSRLPPAHPLEPRSSRSANLQSTRGSTSCSQGESKSLLLFTENFPSSLQDSRKKGCFWGTSRGSATQLGGVRADLICTATHGRKSKVIPFLGEKAKAQRG